MCACAVIKVFAAVTNIWGTKGEGVHFVFISLYSFKLARIFNFKGFFSDGDYVFLFVIKLAFRSLT